MKRRICIDFKSIIIDCFSGKNETIEEIKNEEPVIINNNVKPLSTEEDVYIIRKEMIKLDKKKLVYNKYGRRKN